MRDQYYYVITSLPYISLSEGSHIGRDDFLASCKNYLKRTDFEMLGSVSLFYAEEGDMPPGVIRRFFRWERGVRNVLVRLRTKSLGRESDELIRDEMVDHSQVILAEEAFNANSPLMAEEILNKARWRYLDELEFGHYFDIERLIVYFVKLQILERISSFDVEEGRERLNAIISQGAPDTD
ncbi:MAG: DUF2764 domain-containing protein [Candidatus Scalindua rubra]|uniref:DUF2764 domain-containing protein n=1 Tax=Candidatus Scalindua brodae TaxID=237368 RepID=A0A0B0EI09_9BACT|nr:MAG: hypothetical protein SCABRO_01562 [Candidatus Scalindua brodae]MBZ0108733.1 DUF2764 domain-containing protein [Candidatus Scalindua rubra]TWU31876.1 hypothetical protein S225a_19580 [Candidatus Brocadiaceae bacterium S225]